MPPAEDAAAVDARYVEGPFPLPAPREQLVARIEQLLEESERAIEACRSA